MSDYAELVKALRTCKLSIPCTECPFYSNGDEPSKECATMNVAAAGAIEELLAGLERYRHAAFVISETCVEESKCHISPEEAIKKIRENIYYFRQMPLPEPPKEVQDG